MSIQPINLTVPSVGPAGPPGPPGPVGPQGLPGPPGGGGAQGPIGPPGQQGPDGPQGDQGIPGNTVLYGVADPGPGAGVDGNFYINTTTHFIFGPKASGAWPAGTSLIGPQGPIGTQGPQGPQGPQGTQGPAGPTGGSFPDAPADSHTYGRNNNAWVTISSGSSVYVSDTPPTGAPANSLWWESDNGILYCNYNDGDSTQWVSIVSATDPTTYALRYDTAQALTAAQQVQARQNVYAAPFDALSYNGMQINGAMDVSQELGTSGTITNNTYILDGLKLGFSGTMVFNGYQVTGRQAGCPLNAYCGVTVQTAQASLGVNDWGGAFQSVEGYRVARLAWGTANAQPVTIGFWSAHSLPGTYSICAHNSDASRSYVTNYTQNVANAWEYKTVTIPGDTAGTWLSTNGVGLTVIFQLACGTTFQTASPNTWLAGNFMATSNQPNLAASLSNAFRITGVMILPGLEAPLASRAPFIMRPYDQELLMCKRHYQKILSPPGGAMGNGAATIFFWSFPYPVSMRSSPSVSLSGNMTFSSPTATYVGTSVSSNYGTADVFLANLVASTAVPSGFIAAVNNSSSVIADARF